MKKFRYIFSACLICLTVLIFPQPAKAAEAGSGSQVLVEGTSHANFSNVVVFVYFEDADADYLDQQVFAYSTASNWEHIRETYSGESLYSLSSYMNAISYGQLRVQNIFPQYNGTTIEPYKITCVTKAEALAGQGKNTIVREVLSNLDGISGYDLDLYGQDGLIDNLQVVLIQNDDSEFTCMHKTYDGTLNWSGKGVSHYNFIGTNSIRNSDAGIMSHEFLHSIGFPDLYNLNYDYPVGLWDIMGNTALKQSYPLSYLRAAIGGWFSLDTISESTTSLVLDNQELADGVHGYILSSPLNENEVFVVEMRKRNRSYTNEHLDYFVGDYGMNGYAGIIVYRVKKNVEGLSNYAGDTAVYVFRPEAVTVNGSTSTDSSTCIQYAYLNKESGRTAIGNADLNATQSDGALTFSDGSNSGIVISNVSSGAEDQMTFDVTFPEFRDDDIWETNTLGSADYMTKVDVADYKGSPYLAVYYNDAITFYEYSSNRWVKTESSITGLGDLLNFQLLTCDDALSVVYNTYDQGLVIKEWENGQWAQAATVSEANAAFDAVYSNGNIWISYIDGDYPTYHANLAYYNGESIVSAGSFANGFLGQPHLDAEGDLVLLSVYDGSGSKQLIYSYQMNAGFQELSDSISGDSCDVCIRDGIFVVVSGVSNGNAKFYTYNGTWNDVTLQDTFTNIVMERAGSRCYLAGAYDQDNSCISKVYELNAAKQETTKIGENISLDVTGLGLCSNTLYVGGIRISGQERSAVVAHIPAGEGENIEDQEIVKIDLTDSAAYTVTVTVSDVTYTAKAQKHAVTVTLADKDGSAKKTLVEGVDYTLSYKNNTAVGTATVTVTGIGNYTGTMDKTFAIRYGCKTPVISKVENVTSGIKVTWGAVSGAEKYRVYAKEKGADSWTKIANTTSTSVTITKIGSQVLESGKTYYVTVRCIDNNVTYFTSALDKTGKSCLRLANTTTTLSNVSSGVQVRWTKVSGAAGYKVYRKTTSGSYSCIKKITSGSTLSYTDTGASHGTVYYYAVRPYYSSIYGSYVSKLTIRLKTVTPTITSPKTKQLKVAWSKVSSVTGYEIQYSKSSAFSSKTSVKVSGASSSSKTLTLKAKTKYYVRVRTYKTYNGTICYSAWSSTKSLKTK